MSPQSLSYVSVTIFIGLSALSTGLFLWSCEDPVRFATYLLVSMLTSGWKVQLPGIHGNMSANFFYVILGFAELTLGETMLLGCVSALTQSMWRAKSKPQTVKIVFNIASIATAAAIGYGLYHHPLLVALSPQFPLRLAAAACAYFLANTIPVAIVVALTEKQRLIPTWHNCYFWSFPYYLVGAACAGLLRQLNSMFGWQATVLVAPITYLLYRSYQLYLRQLQTEKTQAETQRKHAEEMASLHLRTIEALALAIEAKDQTTHDHLRRVQVYSLEIGKQIGLDCPQLEALVAASLLHDIGKLAVPEHIISKPGKLTPEEFERMKIHPVVGSEILERVQFPYPVVPIVRHHHEKWDGSGYPDGLHGEQIPIGARILSAVDCLDALATDRPYRRALPLDEAMAAVEAQAGQAYDPRVVGILGRIYRELEMKARQANVIQLARLSTDIRIERGAAPAAGFEKTAELLPSARGSSDFTRTIASARQEAQILFEVTEYLVRSLSLEDTLGLLADRLKMLIPFDCITLYLLRDGKLVPEFSLGIDAPLFRSLEIPLGQGLSGWVAEKLKPIVNGNPSVEPGYLQDPNKFSQLRSALAVPLDGAAGRLGTLSLYSAAKDAFSIDHLRVLLSISSKLAVSIENNLRYRQAEDNATTDYLTGIPNARSLFFHLSQECGKARTVDTPVTVFVCDLDGFKGVNDRFGHLQGNHLLQRVAATLRKHCRSEDFVARMGGDEFVMVSSHTAPAQARALSDRLRHAIENAGFELIGERVLSASIGSASLPHDAIEVEQLLAIADHRMYQAKHEGKRTARDLKNLQRALERPALEPEVAGAPLGVEL